MNIKQIATGKKIFVLIAAVLVTIALIIAAFFYFAPKSPNETSNSVGEPQIDNQLQLNDAPTDNGQTPKKDDTAANSIIEEVVEKTVTNPMKNKPDINPASQTNPIKNVKTNPFE